MKPKTKCEKQGYHKFRPRYSRRFPAMSQVPEGGKLKINGDPFEQIYECDVCIRCGAIAKETENGKEASNN